MGRKPRCNVSSSAWRVHDLLGDGVEHLAQEIREAAAGMACDDRDAIAGGVRSAMESRIDFEDLEACVGELEEMGALIQRRIITMPCGDRHYVYRLIDNGGGAG